MIIQCEYTEMVPIDQIKLNPLNRNKHPKDQIERLAKLIDEYGCRHPILISRNTGWVVAGEGRYLAMKKLGWKEIPVDYQEFANRDEEIAFGIADNASALWAELDFPGINIDLQGLGPGFDVDLLGIRDFEICPEDKPKKAPENPKNTECPACGHIFDK